MAALHTRPSIEEALEAVMLEPPPAPESLEQIAPYFGDTRAERTTAIYRALRDDELVRSRRTVERWFTEAAQRRRPNPRALERLRVLARARQLAAFTDNGALLERRGARMRLQGQFRVSRVVYTTAQPADLAGRRRHAFIDGELLRATVARWRDGERSEAADELLHAFYRAYWEGWDGEGDLPAEPVVIVECQLGGAW